MGDSRFHIVRARAASDIAFTGIQLDDVDLDEATSGNLLTVIISTGAGNGTLSAQAGTGITVTGGDGTASLTITGTEANLNTYLGNTGGIEYTGDTNVGGDDADTLTLVVSDNGESGTTGGIGRLTLGPVNVDIAGDNDPPVDNGPGIPTDVTVTEDVASPVQILNLDLFDPDIGSGNATVTVSTGGGSGTVSAISGAGVTVLGGSGTGTMSLSGTRSSCSCFA